MKNYAAHLYLLTKKFEEQGIELDSKDDAVKTEKNQVFLT